MENSIQQEVRVSPRLAAQRLLTAAKSIFVIYSTADLALASDLRRRIIRLRRDRSGDDVFLAAESLPVGQDVSPENVRSALAAADLAVVACGERTSRSPFVIEEVQQALRQRESKPTQILPIILKTGVKLPDGLDFSIQAIHRMVLFPSIRWIRIALATAVAAITITALFFARQNMITEIQRRIDLDNLSQPSPIDLGRVATLETLRATAAWLIFRDGLRILDQKLRVAGRAGFRYQWRPPDNDRIDIAADPSENIVWVGYRTRIEALEWSTGKNLRSYDLTKFQVDYFKPERIRAPATTTNVPAETEEGDFEENSESSGENSQPMDRLPAHLLRLRTDPRVAGILVEIEYDRFATPSDANDADHGQEGKEREILRLARNLERPESVGLSYAYESQDGESIDGLDYGTEWEEFQDNSSEIEQTLSRLADSDKQAIGIATGATHAEDGIYRLARDPLGAGSLIGIEIRTDKRFPDDFENVEGMRDYLAGLFAPEGEFKRLTPITKYHPRARKIAFTEEAPPYVDQVPKYKPAAIFLRESRVWIYDALLEIGSGFNADEGNSQPGKFAEADDIREIQWLSDGSALRMIFTDGSLGRCAPDAVRELHRFLRPAGARAIDLSPDGKRALVLHADGRLEAWSIDSFGTDGWIGPALAPKQFKLAVPASR